MTAYDIIHGHALEVLRGMPDTSVQSCITSPPYYGLRSYKTEPMIWGGDADCQHVWGHTQIKVTQPSRDVSGGLGWGRDKGTRGEQGYSAAMGMTASQGNFCQQCNAWRGELGLEPDFRLYIAHLVEIFREVKRVLKDEGCCFVNLGDSYANDTKWGGATGGKYVKAIHGQTNGNGRGRKFTGIPAKSLMNIPGRFAIAMTDELQMIQRNELIWYKRACMPSSAKDRWTVDFEPVYFFTKNAKYKFNQQLEPIKQVSLDRVQYGWKSDHDSIGHIDVEAMGSRFANPDGRNARTLLDVPFEPQSNSHYASYPTKLAERFILAGSDAGDTVLDIFNGTASTGIAALRNGRNYVGIELNPEYIKISKQRLAEIQVELFL